MGSDETRAKIMESALAAFAESGFGGVSVPAIASGAGVAAGTMYRHFASKEALVNALFVHWKSALRDHLLADFPFGASPEVQFLTLWRRLHGFAQAHPRAIAFLELHHHGPYLSDASLSVEREVLLPILGYMQAGQATGAVREVPAEGLIAMVWGAFVGIFKAESMGYLSFDEALMEQLGACCWDAVRARRGEEVQQGPRGPL